MSAFTDRLLELIERRGISKNKLLKTLSINKMAISNWISRGNIPKHDTLEKIADYFNVSVEYLLGNTDDPQPAGVLKQGEPLTLFHMEVALKKLTDDELRTLALRALEELERRKGK